MAPSAGKAHASTPSITSVAVMRRPPRETAGHTDTPHDVGSYGRPYMISLCPQCINSLDHVGVPGKRLEGRGIISLEQVADVVQLSG
jgi:hypothetical protein